MRWFIHAHKLGTLLLACACLLNAQADDCLARMKGNHFLTTPSRKGHVFTVTQSGKAWQFNKPTDPFADPDNTFKYDFTNADAQALPAQPIAERDLRGHGLAILAPYLERAKDAQGIAYGCGLTTDSFYVVDMDLSGASETLIKNMVILTKAQARAPHHDAPPTPAEMQAMRQQRYFAGHPFRLEGVTSGVVGVMLRHP